MGSIVNRERALAQKHARLEAEINEELARPVPDSVVVRALKTQKLVVRDNLATISSTNQSGGELRHTSDGYLRQQEQPVQEMQNCL